MMTRHRLGLALYEHPGTCGLCGQYVHGIDGEHAGACMAKGLRTILHTKVTSALFQALSLGLCHPQREVACFPVTDPTARMDIVCRGLDAGTGTPAIDVALTGNFSDLPASAEVNAPGAVATRYEVVKWRRYGKSVTNAPPSLNITPTPGDAPMALVPFVMDIYGAMGKSARNLMPKIAARIARRLHARGHGNNGLSLIHI